MSTVRSPATVLDDGVSPLETDWCATRLPGAPPGAEAWDPVVELVHDLRSPLGSILLLSQALLRDTGANMGELQRQQLAMMYGAALGLTLLLADVDDLAGGGDGLLDREAACFRVDEVLESVADVVQPLAREKGLSVRMICPKGERRMGHGPALRRVLLNLTTNALKFTTRGSVEISATPQTARGLVISVRDTGRGLPRPVVEALARPLGPSVTGRGHAIEPASMGLTICRRLVRSMGSDLEFETRPGRGTRFHFHLDQPRPGPLATIEFQRREVG